MNKTILLSCAIWLTACATSPKPVDPPPAPQVVEKVVTVSCVQDIPAAPVTHTTAELIAMADYQFVTALHADRLALNAYAEKLSAILSACK